MLLRSTLLALSILACSLLCMCQANIARADDPPAAQPAQSQHPEDDPLRGPRINTSSHPAQTSLIDRDFSGRLKKLEDHPVLVALSRMDLTPEERQAADKVIGDRAAALDTLVRDHLKEIVEFGNAKEAKDQAGVNRLQGRILEIARPFLKRGTMLSEVRAALPPEKADQLTTLVREYYTAASKDRMADPATMEEEKKNNRFARALGQNVEGFGLEAKAAFQRVVQQGGKEFDQLLKTLQLTPEQEGRIRQEATDLYLKTYGKPTKAQQFALFMTIYGQLDTEQRHRLATYIGEENRVRRAAKNDQAR